MIIPSPKGHYFCFVPFFNKNSKKPLKKQEVHYFSKPPQSPKVNILFEGS